MNTMKPWFVVLLISVAFAMGAVAERPILASGMNGTWSGASASASLFSLSQSQQGAVASASENQTLTITYPGLSIPQTNYTATVSAGVTASASDDTAHLLQVTASAYSPNPGQIGGPTPNNALGMATWTNDAAVVTGPAGSELPDSIRLNFTVTFTAPWAIVPSGLTATINGTKLTYGINLFGNPYSNNNGLVDSSKLVAASGSSQSTLTETFHLNLALNQAGVSSPINLGLQLSPPVGLVNGTGYSYTGLSGNLALSSVTLPDGTSLASLGDTVSFESGLASPNAVPEPSSLIVWGLIAMTAGATAVARSRSVPRRC
jgi:hypothetical protein